MTYGNKPRDLKNMERRAQILFEDKSIEGIDIRAFKKPDDGLYCLQFMSKETTNRVTWGMNVNYTVDKFKSEMERMSGNSNEFFEMFCRRFGKPE